MPLQPFGTITFVISEKHGEHAPITQPEAEQLTGQFLQYFNSLLTERGFDRFIQVTDVQWTVGCVTIVITLGTLIKILAGGSVVAGGVKVFKDYKDFRDGFDKMLNDLKNVKGWFKRINVFKRKAPVTPSALPEVPEHQEEDPVELILENISEQYKSTDPEHRKYYHVDQKVTMVNEKGEYCKVTISVMREDIADPSAGKTTIVKKEKAKKKISKKTGTKRG
jgi:hypothetical protein